VGTINVTELNRLPFIDGNVAPIMSARKVDSKTYTSTTISAQADAPETDCRFLRVAVVEAHFVALDGAADGNSVLLPAGSVEYFEAGRLNYRSVA